MNDFSAESNEINDENENNLDTDETDKKSLNNDKCLFLFLYKRKKYFHFSKDLKVKDIMLVIAYFFKPDRHLI